MERVSHRTTASVAQNLWRSLSSMAPPIMKPYPTADTDRDLEEHTAPETAPTDDDQVTLIDTTGRNTDQSKRRAKSPCTLITLPSELLLLILVRLPFPDIVHLRRTCTYLHAFASPAVIRSLFGPEDFHAILMAHCRICMSFEPTPFHRLRTTPMDAGYPLSSRCIPCAMQSRDGSVRVGRRVILGDAIDYWVCRWCGWPITSGNANGHVQFHQPCYHKYARSLLFFYCLGWVQFVLSFIASALCWKYFRREMLVFAPSLTNFLLIWISYVVLMFRGARTRTYHWTLFIEIAIVGLWIAPIWRLAQLHATSQSARTLSTMTMIASNLLFRLLNILGNIVLAFEYDRTKHYIPKLPLWRRVANPFVSAVIFWTYPPSVEQKKLIAITAVMNQLFFVSRGNSNKSKKSSHRTKKTKSSKSKEATSFAVIENPLPAFAHPLQVGGGDGFDEEEPLEYHSNPSREQFHHEMKIKSQPSQFCPIRRRYLTTFHDFWNTVRCVGPFIHSPGPDQPPGTSHPVMTMVQQQPPDNTAVHFAVHDYTTTSAQAPNGIKFVVSCSLGDVHHVADWVAPVSSARRLVVRGLSGQGRPGSDLAALVRDGLTSLSLEIFRDDRDEAFEDRWGD